MEYRNATFSSLLRARRIEARLTREDLSVRTGIAPDLVVRYESGQASPDLEGAYALARALDCGIDDLVGLPRPSERKRLCR